MLIPMEMLYNRRRTLSEQNTSYVLMTKARQDFIAAWRSWLATHPPADDVQMEREGTGRALTDLARLAEMECEEP
jgi:hypothetical protein